MDETPVGEIIGAAADEPAPAPAPDPAADPVPDPIGELVERWWGDHFPGSWVARDTQAWNVAYAAKEDLKQRLRSK
jgi:hypothetical protein